MNFSSSSAVHGILMFSPKVENGNLFATFPLLQIVSKIDMVIKHDDGQETVKVS